MILLNHLASRGETSKRNAVTSLVCNHRVMIGVVKKLDGGVCRSGRKLPLQGTLESHGRLMGPPFVDIDTPAIKRER